MVKSELTYYQNHNIVLYYDIEIPLDSNLFPFLRNLTNGITYDSFNDLPLYIYGMSFKVIIFWDGIRYPHDKIIQVNNRADNVNVTRCVLFNLEKVDISYTLFNFNSLKQFKSGLELLYKFKVYKLLSKLAYTYWYEELNQDGVSRMCLWDTERYKN